MQSNVKDGVLFANPTSDGDRQKVASSCVRKLHIAMPALIDSVQNRVEKEYTGWPDRIYLIDTAGKIWLKTEAGPFGFDAKILADTLRAYTVIKKLNQEGITLRGQPER